MPCTRQGLLKGTTAQGAETTGRRFTRPVVLLPYFFTVGAQRARFRECAVGNLAWIAGFDQEHAQGIHPVISATASRGVDQCNNFLQGGARIARLGTANFRKWRLHAVIAGDTDGGKPGSSTSGSPTSR